MTTRKGQNSILFLTTLGVYLGLVLVGGASPQVFAHPAATTRNFELSDEIEFKDDLDKKPDPTNETNAADLSATNANHHFVPLAIFLKQFRPFAHIGVIGAPATPFQFHTNYEVVSLLTYVGFRSTPFLRLPQLSVLHLPRASIDDILAKDAK